MKLSSQESLLSRLISGPMGKRRSIINRQTSGPDCDYLLSFNLVSVPKERCSCVPSQILTGGALVART